MNKAQLVEAVALDANISKVDARKAVDAIIRVTVHSLRPVSYTHLDVYKRQDWKRLRMSRTSFWALP